MCVDDEDDLCSTVLLQECLCNGEVGGGLVMMIVDIGGVCGGRCSVEGAFHKHQLCGCEPMIFMTPDRPVEGCASLTELSFPTQLR